MFGDTPLLFQCHVVATSEAALLCEVAVGKTIQQEVVYSGAVIKTVDKMQYIYDQEAWIPRSQLGLRTTVWAEKDEGKVEIPQWLAKTKGWIKWALEDGVTNGR